MPRNLTGLSTQKITPDARHPPWAPPSSIEMLCQQSLAREDCEVHSQKSLHVLNSLTDTLVPFAPRSPDMVRWYTCGPTVYDSAHMGHARAYLTFDILRRIMQEYFHYNVFYQMNITDLDDKIIRRARINKLLKDYSDALPLEQASIVNLCNDIEKAVHSAKESLRQKEDALSNPLPEDATSRVRDEREEKLKEMELKKASLQAIFEQLDKNLEQKSNTPASEWIPSTLALAREVLGEWLDKTRGHEIQDPNVFESHARHYEKEFWEDMHALGVQSPDVITRVTEYLPQIIAYIQAIEKHGFAYASGSSVYFDLNAYIQAGHSYPKLKAVHGSSDRNATLGEMEEGEGVLMHGNHGEKRNPNDFALWKFSKKGEPAWDSPWGPGRPGWHIECSAMGSDVLGENMDIHAGGCDLKFPHHDNEVAQAEAYWGHDQWVNYFLHAGHLHIRGLKMAKSLKNFITIRQALKEHTAQELRMMFLLQLWHRPMNYSDQSVAEARERLRTIRAFLATVQNLERGQAYLQHEQLWSPSLEGTLATDIASMTTAVDRLLRDNFNTPGVIDAITDLIASVRRYIKDIEEGSTRASKNVNVPLVLKAKREIMRILTIFGLGRIASTDSNEDNMEVSSGNETLQAVRVSTVAAFVQFREDVRNVATTLKEAPEARSALLQKCDQVRDDVMPQLGVRLEDATSAEASTMWSFQDPEILKREQKQRKEEAVRVVRAKIEAKLKQKQAELDKWLEVSEVHKVGVKELIYGNKELYDQWDSNGHPTRMKLDGAEVTKSAWKKIEKEYKKFMTLVQDYELKGGASYLASVEAEVIKLKAQLDAANVPV